MLDIGPLLQQRDCTKPKSPTPPVEPSARNSIKRRGLMVKGGAMPVGIMLTVLLCNCSTSPSQPMGGSQASVAQMPESLHLEMVNLPGGSFTMGTNDGYYGDEKPAHRVTVGPFAIGKYEVSQAQWQAVMGSNPSNFKGDSLPVENVSWKDAQLFCSRLGDGYRLPTEAEWEYAARAGSKRNWSFGDEESKLGEYAWFSGNSGNQTHPVGQKKANGFGLFDMPGNVWEWCEDDWHDNYDGAPADATAWKPFNSSVRGANRVLRGGAYYRIAFLCRSVSRGFNSPDRRNGGLGFRLARTLR